MSEQQSTPQIIETQPDRTDLPLAVMPTVFEAMIEPFIKNLPLLHDIARVRMYTDRTTDKETLLRRSADADAVMVIGFHIPDATLDRFCGFDGGSGHVHCFAFGGTGVASYINMAKTHARNVRVCNIVHYGDHAVAEHTFALILELAREAGRLNAEVRSGDWTGAEGYALHGKTLGLVGFGGIGQTVARIANGFGMHVAVWNSHVDPSAAAALGVESIDDMGDLMERADIVSLHLPLLESTAGIITARQLDRMRSGTLFVNTARAEIIEPGALTERLLRGDIQAALDVFDHEPLPMDDPLRTVPGIVLTPHVAWRNDEAYVSLTRQVVQSVASFFTGGDFNVAN
ncbi:D-2-hydroxyacid dehydrogenase family protein [Bifidobacterium simiiventris]|uniref:D-2-hydroxyacid dehydrogenase family protein n=1 Tax=Bifidobacterium simiiventris TaxID=2834434 RepID=UPI001C56CAF3|nr:D-2-hydroxyacid dehydrogenase family protein [Bifidobacterium simiiventris]MBW3078868.1 D-2-hydroxyacid dehydrogenase family protein [Bifidobacterium simiiventris]